jgi:hypothetical protein
MKLLEIINVGFGVRVQVLKDFFRSSLTGEKWEYNEKVQKLFIDFKKAYNSVMTQYFTILS